MRFTIRLSNWAQLKCLRHPCALSNLVLSLFYSVEVSLYTLNGAKSFLTRRNELFGPNYAALGKLIVGEHAATAGLIEMPQQRGDFLGRARLVGDRLPHGFLLSLSDEEAGGDGLHRLLRSYLWTSLIEPAQARAAEDPVLEVIVREIGEELRALGPTPTKEQVRSPLERFVIRYMFRLLYVIDVDDQQLDTLQVLFYTGGLTSNYTAALIKPFALPSLFLGGLNTTMAEVVGWIRDSEALGNYTPSEDNANLTKEQWAELLTSVIGIAALGGAGNLAIRMVSEYPPEHEVDLEDDMAVMRVVLESARRHAPVNNINVVLPGPRTFRIQGESVELPAGTVVAASIGLASLDEHEFPDPEAFQPDRDNLLSSMVNFNTIGFHPSTNTGRRTCPGRNLAVGMGVALFRSWRRALA